MDISNISALTSLTSGDVTAKKLEQQGKSFQEILENTKVKQEDKDQQLKKACQDFEAYFIYQMFKEMDSTVMKSDLVPMGRGEKMFKNMLYQEMADQSAKGSSMGIADMMYKQMSRGNNITK